jgi:hypothetical protein
MAAPLSFEGGALSALMCCLTGCGLFDFETSRDSFTGSAGYCWITTCSGVGSASNTSRSPGWLPVFFCRIPAGGLCAMRWEAPTAVPAYPVGN